MITTLHEATFRGVPFIVSSESTDSGKKLVTHEYPNSDKRFCEEMGRSPKRFSINGIVHGPNALLIKGDLEAALELPGLGILIHPIYGYHSVMAGPYTVSTNQSEQGVFIFSMNFMVSESDVSLIIGSSTQYAITSKAEEARDSLNDALGDEVEPPTLAQNLSALAGKVNGAVNSVMDKARGAVGVVTSTVAAANQFVTNFNAQVNSIVLLSSDLQSSISDFYTNVLTLCDTPDTLLGVWEDLLSYGTSFFEDTSDEKPITMSTVIRIEREKNRSIINEHTRIMAMVNMIEAMAYKDYSTDAELLEKKALADSAFKSLIYDKANIQDGIPSLADNPGVRAAMNNLRITSRAIFDQKSQNLWRIVNLKPNISSALLMSYQYYSTVDNVDLLTALNKNVKSSYLTAEIVAVTE